MLEGGGFNIEVRKCFTHLHCLKPLGFRVTNLTLNPDPWVPGSGL